MDNLDHDDWMTSHFNSGKCLPKQTLAKHKENLIKNSINRRKNLEERSVFINVILLVSDFLSKDIFNDKTVLITSK